jgi:hypothetical protein
MVAKPGEYISSNELVFGQEPNSSRSSRVLCRVAQLGAIEVGHGKYHNSDVHFSVALLWHFFAGNAIIFREIALGSHWLAWNVVGRGEVSTPRVVAATFFCTARFFPI